MTLKSTPLLLLTLLFLVSCKEDTTYQMQLIIENTTDHQLTIELFPKNEYLQNDLYKFCDFGGGYRETTFDLATNHEIEIFISSDLNVQPHAKATAVFDSIHISNYKGEETKIRFSSDQVVGYDENLFSEESTWIMKIRNYESPTSFQHNPVESNNYIFTIH